MENFAELMQRLLELQSGGRPRSLAVRGRRFFSDSAARKR
jgi:hypothetical protein